MGTLAPALGIAGGCPADGADIESNVVDEFDERDTVGASGLGIGSGSKIRLLLLDMVDSDLIKFGGAKPRSASVVSEPFEVPVS